MTLQISVDVAVDLSHLALDVAGQPRPADMTCRVTQLAAKLVDGAAADLIRITDHGHLRVLASSDPGVSELTAQAWREWPHTAIPVDGSADAPEMMLQRSSYMQQVRCNTNVLQELILPLTVGRSSHGSLRFLFTEPMAADANRALIGAFCAHAAIALDRAALISRVENLQLALQSNRDIGAAVGVLMASHQLTYEAGLGRIRTASQNGNRKMQEVAAQVLYTGQLPVYRTAGPAGKAGPADRSVILG